jgi:sarcosine dehydrogenase
MGELGFELHMPKSESAMIYNLLRKTGEEYELKNSVPIRDAGYRAIDSLSAEKNFRHWHADLTNADTPLEAGIGFTVLKKLKRADSPDFVGRKALEK